MVCVSGGYVSERWFVLAVVCVSGGYVSEQWFVLAVAMLLSRGLC